MYGAQASSLKAICKSSFENDVEMYGAQAVLWHHSLLDWFENDVEMYGAQANTSKERL